MARLTEISTWLILFFLGHFALAVGMYLNHRFVFHGRVPKWLSWWKHLHTQHHRHEFESDYEKYDGIPLWGWLIISFVVVLLCLASPPFGFGVASYAVTYELVHYASHKRLGRLWQHHMNHHWQHARRNYATFWTFIDKVGGTYVDSSNITKPERSRERI